MGIFSKLWSFLSLTAGVRVRGVSGTEEYPAPHDLYVNLLTKLMTTGERGGMWVHFENKVDGKQFVEVAYDAAGKMGLNVGHQNLNLKSILSQARITPEGELKSPSSGLYDVGGMTATDIARIVEAIFAYGFKLRDDHTVVGWIDG